VFFFDFANTKKDIILFTYDYDEYMSERGTYFDMDSLPFLRIDNVERLAEYLNTWKEFIPNTEYLNFCENYCRYDSRRTPEYVNDAVLLAEFSKEIKVLSYEKNKKQHYHIHFMSNLKGLEQQQEFEEMVDNASSDDLFVFAQWSFSKATEGLLYKYANSGIKYVVTPGEMPATFSEVIKLFLYRKLKIFKGNAKRIYSQELQRILPGINIKQITNHSNDPKFNDICSVIDISQSGLQ